MMTPQPFSESFTFRLLVMALVAGLCISFIIYFKDLLKPIAMALIVWYLIKTIYNLIGKIKIRGNPLPRLVRSILSLGFLFVVVEITLDLIISNLSQMIANYSVYKVSFDNFMVNLGGFLGIENITVRMQEQLNQLDLQGFLSGILSSLSSVVGNLVIVVIYVVFMLIEEVSFSKKINLLFRDPERRLRTQKILDAIFESTNKYITLKTLISLLTAALSYIILILFGVDYAFLWAFLIFLFNFIPYIGSLVATLAPALFALLQFGSIWYFVWVLVCVEIVQVVVGNYVEPKIMGRSLNLSPLVVVVSLSFWGYVWDILGMFLSVPITSIMLITLAQFPATRNLAILLTENGNIDNIVISKEGTGNPI